MVLLPGLSEHDGFMGGAGLLRRPGLAKAVCQGRRRGKRAIGGTAACMKGSKKRAGAEAPAPLLAACPGTRDREVKTFWFMLYNDSQLPSPADLRYNQNRKSRKIPFAMGKCHKNGDVPFPAAARPGSPAGRASSTVGNRARFRRCRPGPGPAAPSRCPGRR